VYSDSFEALEEKRKRSTNNKKRKKKNLRRNHCVSIEKTMFSRVRTTQYVRFGRDLLLAYIPPYRRRSRIYLCAVEYLNNVLSMFLHRNKNNNKRDVPRAPNKRKIFTDIYIVPRARDLLFNLQYPERRLGVCLSNWTILDVYRVYCAAAVLYNTR